MSLQETLETEASGRYPGLNANLVVAELLTRIRGGAGGISAFINELRAQGLSDAVACWLRQDSSRDPTVEQTEHALGRECIEQAAKLNETSFEATARQLAFLMPKAVSGAAAEDASELYGNMPPRAVAWAILVALLIAIGGLYWYVSADNPPVAQRAAAGAQQPPGSAQIPSELPKPVTPLAAAKPAPSVPAEPPVVPAEPTASVPKPPANGQRGNRFAVAALEALKPGATARDISTALNLSVINFASGGAAVPADSIELLKRGAAVLKTAAPGTRLEIAGHTDNIGDPAYNVYLSEKRAKAVKEELVKNGVKADALVAKGYGGVRPVASNDTREGRARNRRIEFTVLP